MTLILWIVLVVVGTMIATYWGYVFFAVLVGGLYFAPLIGILAFSFYCMRQPQWVKDEKNKAFFFIAFFVVWILLMIIFMLSIV